MEAFRRAMGILKRSQWNNDIQKKMPETKSVLNDIDNRSDMKEIISKGEWYSMWYYVQDMLEQMRQYCKEEGQ